MPDKPLIETRCKQGKLIITEQHIRVQLPFGAQQKTMLRSTLVGIDSAMATPSIFGIGGTTNLVFHGGGTHIAAELVKTSVANEIKALLGY